MFWFFKKDASLAYLEESRRQVLADIEAEEKRVEFWESQREWFHDRGYTLYRLYDHEMYYPPTDTNRENLYSLSDDPEWPFAYFGDAIPDVLNRPPLTAIMREKVFYAQDAQRRHIAIKRIVPGSDEHRILRFLHENKEEAASNCIVPVLDLLENDTGVFAIMPRWGNDPLRPAYLKMEDMLNHIHCLLKAVNFLHKNFIVHRDINQRNTLVNHFGNELTVASNVFRLQLRLRGKVTYMLCDFDCSLAFTPTKNQREIRLSTINSSVVVSNLYPPDAFQGELDYNPFVFEMGCLGIYLCGVAQQCTVQIPFLAPFLDKLITSNLDDRFTSSEALQFFQDMQSQLTVEQLSLEPLPRGHSRWEPELYDRWKGLPEDFTHQWSQFRAPVPSTSTKILRRIGWAFGGHGIRILRAFRRALRFLRCG